MSFLMRMKEESEKAGLKLSIQKPKIMASGPITSCQICVCCVMSDCNHMNCSPPGISVLGISQERMLGCCFLLQGDLSDPGIEPVSLTYTALTGRFFTNWATWEAK